ncbi:hypothetical protein DMENIID0001_148360 [Sergentomyia squamirostris]
MRKFLFMVLLVALVGMTVLGDPVKGGGYRDGYWKDREVGSYSRHRHGWDQKNHKSGYIGHHDKRYKKHKGW